MTTQRRSEDSAEQVTVTGWVCKHCRRYFGENERAARYCCANSFPCECGGRHGKGRTACDACASRSEAERFFGYPVVPWDGEYPVNDSHDVYIFDEDKLCEYMAEIIAAGERLEDVRLVPCERQKPRRFEMNDFLDEDAGEDGVDASEIDKVVNEWIDANVPKLWYGKAKCRLDAAEVAKAIGFKLEDELL